MAGQIRMTPEAMRGRATEYTTEAGKLNDIIVKMDGLLGALQTEWEGSSSVAYAEKYADLKPSFEAARELINDIATALTNTARIVEDTDNNIANQFRNNA